MTEHDLRAGVCAQARSWLGRREADGSHREIIHIYNQITPLPRGYKLRYDDPWCAGFVSAVAQTQGLTGIVFPECGCIPMIAAYKKAGRWMEDDAYIPQPGDVIFYDWQDSGVGDNMGAADHVGIVIGVSGSVINIIEGNCGHQVQYTARQVNGRCIRGYGLPDYAAAAAKLTQDEPVGAGAASSPNPAGIVIPDPESVPDPDTAGDGALHVPSPSAIPAGWCQPALPVLRIGDASEAVRAAQLLLRGRGFGVGPDGADGDFGVNTEAAVRRFQMSRGIEADGVIGPVTWTELIKFT